MFKNNFKIALRSLWKNKASSFINVFGLTSGLTALKSQQGLRFGTLRHYPDRSFPSCYIINVHGLKKCHSRFHKTMYYCAPSFECVDKMKNGIPNIGAEIIVIFYIASILLWLGF
jgi:hypothetical protein